MRHITIDNYIGVFGKGTASRAIEADNAETVLKKVRESCAEKGTDLETWARLIRANCIIPPDHPFRDLLRRHGVPAEDHLWTLGAIAFGTETPWIAIREISWRKGDVSRPEEEEKAWLDRLARDTIPTAS